MTEAALLAHIDKLTAAVLGRGGDQWRNVPPAMLAPVAQPAALRAGLIALQDVVRCLRETGNYSDEERRCHG